MPRRPQTTVDILAGALKAVMGVAAREGRYMEELDRADANGTGEYLALGLLHVEARANGEDGIPELVEPIPAGWYADPEVDGYVRWWSGTEWAGGPTDPEHVLTDDE